MPHNVRLASAKPSGWVEAAESRISVTGVDKAKKPGIMGGSLGRYGGGVEGKGAEANPYDL